MRIAIAASPTVAIPSLEEFIKGEDELIRVISQPDRPSGRGKVLTPTPVSRWALDHGIELARPERAADLEPLLGDLDLVITIGYGLLIPENLLSIPRHGFLNLHFSLLPRWRGAAPVQRAIEAQDQVSGVTVFQLDAGMDTGPIYTVQRFALDSDITSDELLEELSLVGVDALLESISLIKAGKRPTPQESAGATRAYKLSREEGRIDWQKSAEEVSAHIRAFTSNPGAWTTFRDSTLKISSISLSQQELLPGEISVIDREIYIGTSTQALKISEVVPAGKAPMSARAWANGAHLQPGDHCGK